MAAPTPVGVPASPAPLLIAPAALPASPSVKAAGGAVAPLPRSNASGLTLLQRVGTLAVLVRRAGNEYLAAVPSTPLERWIVSILVLLFLVHFNVTAGSLRLLACRSLPGVEGVSFLVYAMDVTCNTRAAIPWMYGLGEPRTVT